MVLMLCQIVVVEMLHNLRFKELTEINFHFLLICVTDNLIIHLFLLFLLKKSLSTNLPTEIIFYKYRLATLLDAFYYSLV